MRVLSGLATTATLSVDEARDLIATYEIKREDFAEHQKEFEAVRSCLEEGLEPSLDRLLKRGLNGGACARIVCGDTVIVEPVIRELLKESASRQLTKKMETAQQAIASGQDPSTVAANLATSIQTVRGKEGIKTLGKYTRDVVGTIRDASKGKVLAFVKTGIRELDERIGGWQPTLCLVGADPGVGKSALFATTIRSIAKTGKKVGIFSLEDYPTWLSWRYVSDESRIDQYAMRFDRLPAKQLELVENTGEKMKEYEENVLVVDGSESGLKIESIIASCHDMVKNHGVQIIFLDHIGEVRTNVTDRHDLEVAKHLSLLRGIANLYQIPVVVAMHLKRRENFTPSLSDFANSAGAERKARLALGLTREAGSDRLTVHVMKQTNGPSGFKIELQFKGAAAMVYDTEGGLR